MSTKRSKAIYTTLVEVANEIASRRKYKANPHQIAFFCPAEIVALALNISRRTLYRHIDHLTKAGLIDQRGHMTTHNGKTKSDGSLWAINMKPGTAFKAKLSFQDLNGQYRDLTADIDDGKTAWAFLQEMAQSLTPREQDINILIDHLGLPNDNLLLGCSVTVPPQDQAALDSIQEIPEAADNRKKAAINKAAVHCATALNDLNNLRFYQWLFWQALKLERLEKSCYRAIFSCIRRAMIANRAGESKKAGANLVGFLKESAIWLDLRSFRT